MSNSEQITTVRARALLNWYARAVRAFLSEHSCEQIAQLDDDEKRLDGALKQSHETAVCLIGVSGIGKSTLLNAIVAQDRTVAPSGGVGPLTALATEVRYSPEPRLRAEYHTKKRLWLVASALNFKVARDRKIKAQEVAAAEFELQLDESEREDIEAEIREASEPDGEGTPRKMDEFIRTARLMIAGEQNEDRPVDYLADGLSLACSVKPRWGTQLNTNDANRIERIKLALEAAERGDVLIQEQGANARGFRECLRDHAAGFLSPLIRRIEVGWPSLLLQSELVLVDLPGVGVAGDVYKNETQRFVRERARAVVLVVNRAGLTDSVMELLRTTGYWDRLVLSSDDPNADPCSLVLAVTHVDDLATQEWRDLDIDEDGHRPKTKAQVFEGIRVKLRDSLRKQFEQQLLAFTHTEGSAAIRAGREGAAQNLLDSLRIYPVSAIQYRLLLAGNADDPAFLSSQEQSGVPELSEHLLRLARTQQVQRVARIQSLTRRFAESLCNELNTIESSWQSSRAGEEAERIRSALQVVLAEKTREFDSRRSSFRTFLNQTVPEKIKVAVHEAKDEAQKDVNKYLRGLQDAHWATLRAAVRRGGTYLGRRHIDLPGDIALRFQDPVAAVWSQSLLKGIRKETYQLASDIRQIVEEICDWATREEGAHVDEKVIETQKKLVSAQVDRLRDVGKEAIDELRQVVKVKVVEAIERPIHRACKKFVDEGNNRGPGVKNRILEMFYDLSANATDAASVPTETTLLSHYDVVNSEIRKAFKEWGNPLDSAANAIVERHEDRTRRSDSQKRKRVLATIEQMRADGPTMSALLADAVRDVPSQ